MSNRSVQSFNRDYYSYWFELLLFSSNIWNHVRGAYDNFPDFFFVWVFKVVVDSWKFTMLLLYIFWDDWPISMISGSNEQLQQQLEYTLLKLVNFKSAIWHFRRTIYNKILFETRENATETYGMLQTAFGASCMNRASIFEWHKRFKEGRESVRDDEWCGRSKEVNTPELIGQWVKGTMLRF